MVEHLWRYSGVTALPNERFTITGGSESSPLREHLTKIGMYYGKGEYTIDVSELDNLELDSDGIIVVGGGDEVVGGPSPELLEMFSDDGETHITTGVCCIDSDSDDDSDEFSIASFVTGAGEESEREDNIYHSNTEEEDTELNIKNYLL